MQDAFENGADLGQRDCPRADILGGVGGARKHQQQRSRSAGGVARFVGCRGEAGEVDIQSGCDIDTQVARAACVSSTEPGHSVVGNGTMCGMGGTGSSRLNEIAAAPGSPLESKYRSRRVTVMATVACCSGSGARSAPRHGQTGDGFISVLSRGQALARRLKSTSHDRRAVDPAVNTRDVSRMRNQVGVPVQRRDGRRPTEHHPPGDELSRLQARVDAGHRS
jgi:hypothetical protein